MDSISRFPIAHYGGVAVAATIADIFLLILLMDSS